MKPEPVPERDYYTKKEVAEQIEHSIKLMIDHVER